MKHRVWEIQTAEGPFRFLADNKELAIDHAWQLGSTIDFPNVIPGTPKMIAWTEDYAGLDLDEIASIY